MKCGPLAGKTELLAGDCCGADTDCAAGLICDAARRMCTTACAAGVPNVGIQVRIHRVGPDAGPTSRL